MLFKIALTSLINRKFSVILAIFSIAISVAIVLSVEHIRHQAKASFANTISATDLIVGARSGGINLLLYSVFRIGSATNNISWKSYQAIKQQKEVRWAIPISLGDSHKGYRVLGTVNSYFVHYRYGNKNSLRFDSGVKFEGVYDVVLGSAVAKKLQYDIGQKIVLAHGVADISFVKHDDKPFTVVGILKATGTPVDKTVHISLAGMEAIHLGWNNGMPNSGFKISAEDALNSDLTPKSVTAVYLGLKNKISTFTVQRRINDTKQEPLMAILPGVVLSELWQTMNVIEKILALIAGLVAATSLLGMVTMMLSTIKQRDREIAVLRAIGAPAKFIFGLIQLEVIGIVLMGIILGISFFWGGMLVSEPIISNAYGLTLTTNPFTLATALYSLIILLVAITFACLPAGIVYQQSLKQGLTVKE
jgi:putative ABC transport system permease protein